MSQPLGRFAGNWVEVQESVALLRNERDPLTEDCREVSLILAGWMIHLGGKAATAEEGKRIAEEKIADGSALRMFREMVAAQGGDLEAIDAGAAFHAPKYRRTLHADRSGHFTASDCTKIGWAVQRLGAGRERAGEPVEPHAGLEMHVKLGAKVEAGQPLATMFTQKESLFGEPEHLLRDAITIGDAPVAPPPLVRQIISAENKNKFLNLPQRK
jgi:pyrimidine-nucleoside phosphorylase